MQLPLLLQVPGLRHEFTQRTDPGVSTGPFATANLAYHVGDDPDLVIRNRELLAQQLNFPLENLVAAQQVHGCKVAVVTLAQAGRGARDGATALPATDALLTADRELPLLILVADCAPVLLADTRSDALATVHAGWRGAVAGIAGAAVRRMAQEWGARPEDIRAGIGPCLCTECLEVGPEVAEQVPPELRTAGLTRETGQSRPHLDLRAIISTDLALNGMAPQHIEATPACPRCDPEKWFSHRASGGTTGRLGLVAWWE